jgi:hypothetical protein
MGPFRERDPDAVGDLSPPLRTRGPSGRQVGNPSPAPGRGPSTPVQRAPPPVFVECLAPEKGVNTYTLRI